MRKSVAIPVAVALALSGPLPVAHAQGDECFFETGFPETGFFEAGFFDLDCEGPAPGGSAQKTPSISIGIAVGL